MTSLPLIFDAPRKSLPPRHLADLSPTERRAAVIEFGEKPFRADQLSRHYFSRLNNDPAAMTDLPSAVRSRLGDALLPTLLTEVRHVETDQGKTRKTLWKLHDGTLVESVLMRYRDRLTVCVSSQAGCGMACPFCATGQGGLNRNLSTAEIVEQVAAAARVAASGELRGGPVRLSNVVFMGMGEPLLPYDTTLTAIRTLGHSQGLNLGARHITVSTAGVAPGILRLAEEGLQIGLAISLHGPDDHTRGAIMPINKRYPVAAVLDAVRAYIARTHRRVTFEYIMIAGVNDSPQQAAALAELVRGLLCHVNLIPLNPVAGVALQRSTPHDSAVFHDVLLRAGVPVTVRDIKGGAIRAACGQLQTEARRQRRDAQP